MDDIDNIRQEMARIRRELHEDVTEVVDEASEVMDWRAHIRNHPWAAASIAAGLGYFLVPRRHPEVTRTIVAEPRQIPQAFGEVAPQPPAPSQAGLSPWKIAWGVLGFAGPLALNVAQAYASSWIEDFLMRQSRGPGSSERAKGSPESARERPERPPARFDRG